MAPWLSELVMSRARTASSEVAIRAPYGLAFLVVAGAASAVVAGRRLHTPIRRLPNGTRIA
jgi:hypothetical protein